MHSKNYFTIFSVSLVILFITGCEKRDFTVKSKVDTGVVTNIKLSQATVTGVIVDAGNGLIDYGHCLSINVNPGLSNRKTSLGSATKSTAFSSQFDQLQPGIKYYVRGYATDESGTNYSKEISFTTLNGIPVLTTSSITFTGSLTATGGGNISDDGGLTITERGICWNTTGNPVKTDNHTFNGGGKGTFASTMTGLTLGSTYYVRAYATNEFTTSYGQQIIYTHCQSSSNLNTAIDYSMCLTTGGSASWMAVTIGTHDGVDAVRSGTIADNGQTYLQATITGPGIIRFWWKVSSEYSYDFLTFYIDNTVQESISGEVGWTLKQYNLGSGAHVITWIYNKDYTYLSGSDCGWVDQFSFVLN